MIGLPDRYFWMGLAAGCLLLMVGIGIAYLLRRWWKKRRFGEPVDHSLLLVTYGRRMTQGGGIAGLGSLLAADLPADLGIQEADLLLPEDNYLVSVRETDLRLPINHAAVRRVAAGGEAHPVRRNRLFELIQQTRIDLTWSNVWVPLMRGARLRGLWLLGQREENRAYSPEDLRFLTTMAREAAAVLEAMTFAEQERQAAEEMRTLYRQLVTAREAERGRLTRELHDGVLQDLCAISRDLKALESGGQPSAGEISQMAELAGKSVRALRAVCNDLRPPLLQQELKAALKALVQRLDGRSAAPVSIQINTGKLALDDDTALAIFRITQEALNNSLAHANAAEIAVRLTEYPDRLRLTITDDGCGIQGGARSDHLVDQGHYGLVGMRERAAMVGGRLSIRSTVEYGTAVILDLPMAAQTNKQTESG